VATRKEVLHSSLVTRLVHRESVTILRNQLCKLPSDHVTISIVHKTIEQLGSIQPTHLKRPLSDRRCWTCLSPTTIFGNPAFPLGVGKVQVRGLGWALLGDVLTYQPSEFDSLSFSLLG